MITNQDVARTLERIADLLEIRGDNAFKVRAYRLGAGAAEGSSRPLDEVAAEGGLRAVDGFGSALADKVGELLATGRLAYLERLEEEVPPSLAEILQLPGVGPRTVHLLWKEAGVTTLAALDGAARSGRLEGLPRLGRRTVENLVRALDERAAEGARRRRPRSEVEPLAEHLRATLRALPPAERVELAGSYRRRSPTIGDVDLLVATRDAPAVLAAVATLPDATRVVAHGETKCSVMVAGLQVDVRAVTPEQFGAAWQYFTGSQLHNVRLRGRALRMGLTLNEYGLFPLEGGERVAGATEDDVYAALGLTWIPPEERLDRGEIEAAQRPPAGSVPAGVAQEV